MLNNKHDVRMDDLLPLRSKLLDLGQGHLFFATGDDGCVRLEAPLPMQLQNERLMELAAFEYPGGICNYIATAKQLLAAAQRCESSEYEAIDQPPLVCHAPSLTSNTPELLQVEAEGCALLAKTAFVLVAGGLGERLGYSGIKVGLPVETASGLTFLEHYLECFVLWRRQHANGDRFPAFVIMTSDDTHSRTMALLEHLIASARSSNHSNPIAALELGVDVVCVKQETVFCLADNTARIAVDPATGAMLRKPHGHGDVHALLHTATIHDATVGRQARLLDVWRRVGLQYVVFCQDTNATSTWTAPIALAICARERLDMGFTCVPRIPQEAVGLLCHVQPTQPTQAASTATGEGCHTNAPIPFRTVNVEYNKFDPVYRALYGQGDVAAGPSTPYSAFPGSINTLVLRFQPYAECIEASHGTVPEFINPKYKDAKQKTSFKAPTRVESLMQDVALLLNPHQHRVGGIVFDRQLYHPVKNSVSEALAKIAVGGDAHCAATGEENMYLLYRLRLRAIGVSVRDAEDTTDCDGTAVGAAASQEQVDVPGPTTPPRVPINAGASATIQLFPIISLGNYVHAHCTVSSLLHAFPNPSSVRISGRSALVLRGRVIVDSLTLDGALVVEGPIDDTVPPLRISNAVVRNRGWRVVTQPPPPAEGPSVSAGFTGGEDDDAWTEVDRMRGYRIQRLETAKMCWLEAMAAAAVASSGNAATPPLVVAPTPLPSSITPQQQAKM